MEASPNAAASGWTVVPPRSAPGRAHRFLPADASRRSRPSVCRLRTRQLVDKGKRVTRVLWRAALQVPDDEVELVFDAVELDYNYLDDINGRSPLPRSLHRWQSHPREALCGSGAATAELRDAYERRPIHYAAMHGTRVSFHFSWKAPIPWRQTWTVTLP